MSGNTTATTSSMKSTPQQNKKNSIQHYYSEEDDWLVQVYRRTNLRGWERYVSPEEDENTFRSNTAFPNPVKVTPRKGCVEVRQLRLRIYLFQLSSNSNKSSTTPSQKNKTTNADIEKQTKDYEENLVITTSPKHKQQSIDKAGEKSHSKEKDKVNSNEKKINGPNSNTVVIQRLDTILFSTRRGGALVFKFQHKGDCNSFADKLISLNREYLPAVKCVPHNQIPSLHDNQLYHNDDTMDPLPKRRRLKNDSSLLTHLEDNSSIHSNCPTIDQGKKCQVLSYIVRLLHDSSFLQFVDDIERCLASSPECASVYSALGIQR